MLFILYISPYYYFYNRQIRLITYNNSIAVVICLAFIKNNYFIFLTFN